MPRNELLNLPDLLVVGEGEQFENGHENMSVQEGCQSHIKDAT